MNISEILTPRAIAAQYTEVASNRIPYLGEALFPAAKKMGLDLNTIKGHKGLNVHLHPSNFDAKAKLRSRNGFKAEHREMAFFREGMLVSEKDQQDIMRVREANDPYALDVLRHVFDDVNTLVDAAILVPEIMRMQLLFGLNMEGMSATLRHIGILIAAEENRNTYMYDYDPEGEYSENNYSVVDNAWGTADAAPLTDMSAMQTHIENATGTRPTMAIMNRVTFNKMLKSDEVRNAILAQNVNANIFLSDAVVREVLSKSIGIRPVIYDKVYKAEDGSVVKLVPDDLVSLVPDGPLGRTWFGTTPEERGVPGTQIVHTGVAISVIEHQNPVNTETVVSEIVLPSYERMSETALINVKGEQAAG